MRRLVVCCDGTWNDEGDDTNVSRFHELLATTDEQVPHYLDGVGTSGNPISRLVDGVFGAGLAEHIQKAYLWLAETYRPGDELVLIGFSRGAYTVRSLVGMLAQCGLARVDGTARERERLVERVYRDGYRGNRALPDVAFHPGFGPDDVAPVAFLGVWDTVGALGVPATFGLLAGLVGRADVRFKDVALAPDVRHARHAVALDERRGPYVPSLWRTPEPGVHASFAQLWFPGAHGDVGGGKPSRALSDAALRWMLDEAVATVGLRLLRPPDMVGDPCGPADESTDGLWRYLNPRPRSAPRVVEGAPEVHPSAVARQRCGAVSSVGSVGSVGSVPSYRPGVVLTLGESRDVAVPADRAWSETGLYLPVGRYRLAARGTWTDHGAAAPPTGVTSWPVRSWPAYAVGTVLGTVRSAIRSVTTPRADVVGSRRIEGARWMELVAAVADDVLELDGTVREGTTAPLGPDGVRELAVERGGYLYAFANDAWTGYGSNAGAVTLTVTVLEYP